MIRGMADAVDYARLRRNLLQGLGITSRLPSNFSPEMSVSANHPSHSAKLSPVFPTVILRKGTKLLQDKLDVVCAAGVRLYGTPDIRDALRVEDALAAVTYTDVLCETKLGAVKYSAGLQLHADLTRKQLPGSPDVGFEANLYTDFDPVKYGYLELSNEQVGYQRHVPIYLGGPCRGSGVNLKVGAKYEWGKEKLNEGKVKPWIGVSDIRIKPNIASVLVGTAVLSALLAAKLKLQFNAGVKIPNSDKRLKTFVGVDISDRQRPYGLTLFNLCKFEVNL